MRDYTGFHLLICRFAVVLDVSVFKRGVEERGDVWVCCGAVVAFVEVVCQDFPIEMTYSVRNPNQFRIPKPRFKAI
jgi:hypothetical protein